MKLVITFAILAAAGFFISSAMSGPEKAMSNVIDCMDDMTDVLKTIKNSETATKAMPKLQKLGRKMQEAAVDMANSFSKGSPQEMQKIFAKYQKPMEEANQRFSKELMRVNCIPGMDKELQRLFASMNSGIASSSGGNSSPRRG
jgi:septation ring formation regulator EzrA